MNLLNESIARDEKVSELNEKIEESNKRLDMIRQNKQDVQDEMDCVENLINNLKQKFENVQMANKIKDLETLNEEQNEEILKKNVKIDSLIKQKEYYVNHNSQQNIQLSNFMCALNEADREINQHRKDVFLSTHLNNKSYLLDQIRKYEEYCDEEEERIEKYEKKYDYAKSKLKDKIEEKREKIKKLKEKLENL